MAPRRDEIDIFLREIKAIRLENTFNPYSDRCEIYDKANGPELRRQNLRKTLNGAIEKGVESIWLGRDLGYRGGRRTGLALTDEVHLALHAKMINCPALRRATKGPPIGERTALIVWRMLQLTNEPIFLWNIFPLHPHEPNRPLSNRAHTRAERAVCLPLLIWILERLKPSRVITIGRDAKQVLDGIGVHSITVRHPSYGGQNDFMRDIRDIYDVSLAQVGVGQ